jgi:hypothetical protein
MEVPQFFQQSLQQVVVEVVVHLPQVDAMVVQAVVEHIMVMVEMETLLPLVHHKEILVVQAVHLVHQLMELLVVEVLLQQEELERQLQEELVELELVFQLLLELLAKIVEYIIILLVVVQVQMKVQLQQPVV